MNYLTNYYKNLSEQLQEKINMLEANIRSPQDLIVLGKEAYEDAAKKAKMEKERQGQDPFLSTQEISDLVSQHAGPYFGRAVKRERLLNTALAQMGDVVYSGDVETGRQLGDVMADVMRGGPKQAGTGGSGTQILTDVTKTVRGLGKPTNVPADIAAMRKVVQMGQTDSVGRSKYKPPFPQPQNFSPDFHDGPDPGTRADSGEVQDNQQRNQFTGNLNSGHDEWIPHPGNPKVKIRPYPEY